MRGPLVSDVLIIVRLNRRFVTTSVSPLDVVRVHPLCAETPVAALQCATTPAESVYVRSNFETPDAHEAWTVRVSGVVQRPTSLTLADIAGLPQRSVHVTMECAGNWRLGMDPVPEGEPWRYGAVSTTTWSGVSLSCLLDLAGVPPDAREVVAVGADAGPRSDAEGIVRFERSLPIDVAMHPDTLIATHMDGARLTPDHGAPLRVIVPGWYGMASVKWLAGLEVRTEPFTGYFQRQRYVYHTGAGTIPVTRALVKSMVVSPLPGASCPTDAEIRGWAWSGHGAITQVDVAVNDAWHRAALGVPASPYAWTPFSLRTPLPSGDVLLRSRATDASGAVQPDLIEWNSLGYGNNAVRVIPVRVVGASLPAADA